MSAPAPWPPSGDTGVGPSTPGAAPTPEAGSTTPAEDLFALLYADLHRLASSRLQQSDDRLAWNTTDLVHSTDLLHTTDLLHETFLRLRQAAPASFPDKQHFMSYVARTMRSVVVDLVRSRKAQRHQGNLVRESLDPDAVGQLGKHDEQDDEVLRVNDALAALAKLEPRLATVVELRYFAGLTETEIAAMLGLTLRTVQRDWVKARLFLSLALE